MLFIVIFASPFIAVAIIAIALMSWLRVPAGQRAVHPQWGLSNGFLARLGIGLASLGLLWYLFQGVSQPGML